jgi:hypothetical protein
LSAADLKALVDFLLLRDRPDPVAAAKTERPVYSFAGIALTPCTWRIAI